jgi:hypothetical protein
MNKMDKKNFRRISKVVRGLEHDIYTSKKIEERIRQSGIEVKNMYSVLQAIVSQSPYLIELTNGNYLRTERK